VSENRTLYRGRSDLTITFNPEIGGYGLFSRVQPGELKSVLSNVINNAVEAIPPNGGKLGSVLLQLRKGRDSTATILVKDNGHGVAPEIIPLLFQRGATFNKEKGTGEGLAHAKEKIESWGGQIGIISSLGVGSDLWIELPLIAPPIWYLDCINFNKYDRVIILDDDESIHQIWKNRMASPELRSRSILTIHCTNPDEVRSALQTFGNDTRRLICLFDYELLGTEITGLDLLQSIDTKAVRVLVTSHAEEKEIQEACMISNIRLLPKDMAAFIPIR
jgi:hypothetical protein